LTAAHPILPFGTRLRVADLANGCSVVDGLNDRVAFCRVSSMSCNEDRRQSRTSPEVEQLKNPPPQKRNPGQSAADQANKQKNAEVIIPPIR
jgi:hypothetical protein